MLTAHLPSGYCLAKISKLKGIVLIFAVVGAVFPDIDIIFFYFIDDKAIHHHRYWVHIPFFWFLTAAVTLPFLLRTKYKQTALVFFAAIFMHLLLDSISGGIMWLAPFNNNLWQIVKIPPTQSHWILSFIFHWTFIIEILVWIFAFYLFIKDSVIKFMK